MLKAVIFDMDGVIIDSEPMHARAALMALERYNISITIHQLDEYIGSTTINMCNQFIKQFSLPCTADELLQVNDEMKATLLKDEGHTVIPYVIDLIKDLHKNGIKLIIASSSPSEAIEEVLSSLKLQEYFEGYVSGNMVKRTKPDPEIFIKAADKIGVNPSQCVVIEDSYNGVTAANAAGMTCIGFINPNSGKQDLSKAFILVEGFDEVDYAFVNKVYQHAHYEPATLFHTDRLTIRELSLDDIEDLFSICQKPEIKSYLEDFSEDLSIEKDKLKAYIRNIYHLYGYGLWGVYLKDSNRLIGRGGIEYKSDDREDYHEIGYFIDPVHQGNGYAKEFVAATIRYCFQNFEIPRIIANIEQGNLPSALLAQKVGMKKKTEMIRNNKIYDVYEIINTGY